MVLGARSSTARGRKTSLYFSFPSSGVPSYFASPSARLGAHHHGAFSRSPPPSSWVVARLAAQHHLPFCPLDFLQPGARPYTVAAVVGGYAVASRRILLAAATTILCPLVVFRLEVVEVPHSRERQRAVTTGRGGLRLIVCSGAPFGVAAVGVVVDAVCGRRRLCSGGGRGGGGAAGGGGSRRWRGARRECCASAALCGERLSRRKAARRCAHERRRCLEEIGASSAASSARDGSCAAQSCKNALLPASSGRRRTADARPKVSCKMTDVYASCAIPAVEIHGRRTMHCVLAAAGWSTDDRPPGGRAHLIVGISLGRIRSSPVGEPGVACPMASLGLLPRMSMMASRAFWVTLSGHAILRPPPP